VVFSVTGLRVILTTLTVQAALLLGLSYLGPVLPVGDSIAVFRLQIAALVGLGAVAMWLARSRMPALVAFSFAAVAGIPILYGFSAFSAGAPGAYVFYQKNLFRKELSRDLLTRDILSLDPDFVTLQEITDHDLRYMHQFFDQYPSRLICTDASVTKVGVLSRFPLVPDTGTCLEDERLAAAQVQLPDGTRVWLVSLHLGWPYPAGQYQQAKLISDWLDTLEGPVMIGGDFNLVPWGNSVRMIADAARTKRVGPYFGTFPASVPLLPLPIDHIFLPETASGRAEARPRVGSDHLGILARFSF